jgi:hypothetical protein
VRGIAARPGLFGVSLAMMDRREARVEELKRSVRRLSDAPQTDDVARQLEVARRALVSARAHLDEALRDRDRSMRRTGLRP